MFPSHDRVAGKPALDAWLIESTQNAARLEERIRKLLQDIRDATSLADLQARINKDI